MYGLLEDGNEDDPDQFGWFEKPPDIHDGGHLLHQEHAVKALAMMMGPDRDDSGKLGSHGDPKEKPPDQPKPFTFEWVDNHRQEEEFEVTDSHQQPPELQQGGHDGQQGIKQDHHHKHRHHPRNHRQGGGDYLQRGLDPYCSMIIVKK